MGSIPPPHRTPVANTASFPSTFKAEDPISQRVHNVIQGCLVRHVEEVLFIWVAGNVFDFIDERVGVFLPADVVAQDLGRTETSFHDI